MNSVKPSISIIMSVYNGEQFLNESIKSILNQTYTDFEFIITNDCSTDNSKDIIQEFAKKDSRIKFIDNKKNLGLAQSLNNMIKISKAKYIARMDADDIALQNRFEKQMKIIQNNPDIDVVFTGTMLIDKFGNDICRSWKPKSIKKILQDLQYNNYIPHPSIIIKKLTLAEFDNYDTKFGTGQDRDLWIKMRDKRVKFYYLREILLKYRLNPQSVRANAKDRYWFKVANYCIWNKNKLKAFKYFSELNFKEKLIILIKMFIPHIIFYYRGINQIKK